MAEEQNQRILAIDLGKARVGIALSDELHLTAQPLEVIARSPKKKLLERLKTLVTHHNVGEIVVGLPLSLSGEDTPSTVDARQFASLLENIFPSVDIVLWDERMTTTASESMLIDAGVSREKRKGVIDKIAAFFILDSYLAYRRARTTTHEDTHDKPPER